MKTSTLSKKLYQASINYLGAARLLCDNLNYTKIQDIIYLTMFLLRHSAELILKSLICDFLKKQTVLINNKAIWYEFNGEKRKIDNDHSLLKLYARLLEIGSGYLVPLLSDDPNLRKDLELFSKYDDTGEYYRYPISKSGKSFKIKIYSIGESNLAPSINKGSRISILSNEDSVIIKNLDEKVFTNINRLIRIINVLYDLSIHKINEF